MKHWFSCIETDDNYYELQGNFNISSVRGYLMKNGNRVRLAVVLFFLVLAGCFGKTPPYSGESIGRWSISFNDKSTYDFNFDKRSYETRFNCEICCSGIIESWQIEDGSLTGKARCDKMVVMFEGESDDKVCSGEYKVYTDNGEFLRDGSFKGEKI